MRVNAILYGVYLLLLVTAFALKDYQPTNHEQGTEQPPPVRQVLAEVEHPDEIALVSKLVILAVSKTPQPRLIVYSEGGAKAAEIKNSKFLCAAASHAVVYSGSEVSAIGWSGDTLWHLRMAWQPIQGVCESDRTYLVDSQKISTLSSTGEILWDRNVPWSNIPGGIALDTNGTVIAGSINGELAAIDRNGSTLWQKPQTGDLTSLPVPDGKGRIYQTDLGHLSAIDKNRGTVLWQSPILLEPQPGSESLPVPSPDGRVCFARSSLFCFGEDGKQKWRFDPDSSRERFIAAPVFDEHGSAYLYSQGKPGRVYAVSESGRKKWSYPVGDTFYKRNPMVLTSDGKLWKSDENHGFYRWEIGN